jgi:DMSO/TMAO reductase YedYZ molybdopterin-dependent catalytic subunit
VPDRRLTPSPVAVDWGLLVAVAVLVGSGVAGLVAGRPGQGWVFVVHGVAGVALAVLVALKLARVWRRVRPANLTPARALSVALAAVALAALATGVAWTLGVSVPLSFWTLLNVHMWLGALTALLLVGHLAYRLRPARTAPRAARREALQYAGVVATGAVAWRLQQAAAGLAGLSGADRRFTGSREDGSDEGNGFPVTSWVGDDPDPVDADEWTLSVSGLVADERRLTDGDLAPESQRRATLDCTSGWYSVHDWQGVRVGDLLAAAGVDEDAEWVQFRSVTGYRWSLPIAEAREALLATHVDDERLRHGHGFPLRLVAPGRRGFQWVKWVEAVEVRRSRELGELVAIHVSGFGG